MFSTDARSSIQSQQPFACARQPQGIPAGERPNDAYSLSDPAWTLMADVVQPPARHFGDGWSGETSSCGASLDSAGLVPPSDSHCSDRCRQIALLYWPVRVVRRCDGRASDAPQRRSDAHRGCMAETYPFPNPTVEVVPAAFTTEPLSIRCVSVTPIPRGSDGGSVVEWSTQYTVAAQSGAEISRKGVAPAMNTGRMSAKHMDTMDELHDAMRRFVGSGKVVSIEEGRLVRLAKQAMDEAVLLDYAFALLSCGLKENGVFGQRFQQLFREAEAYRAGMLERQEEAA